MAEETYTIGEAAELTGTGAHALRYYERVGLLRPVKRAENGHRRYGEEDLGWVRFLTLLRDTGMPIRRMLEFVELEREGEASRGARRDLLEEHRAEVRRRVRQLERHLEALDAKVAHYRGLTADGGAHGDAIRALGREVKERRPREEDG